MPENGVNPPPVRGPILAGSTTPTCAIMRTIRGSRLTRKRRAELTAGGSVNAMDLPVFDAAESAPTVVAALRTAGAAVVTGLLERLPLPEPAPCRTRQPQDHHLPLTCVVLRPRSPAHCRPVARAALSSGACVTGSPQNRSSNWPTSTLMVVPVTPLESGEASQRQALATSSGVTRRVAAPLCETSSKISS